MYHTHDKALHKYLLYVIYCYIYRYIGGTDFTPNCAGLHIITLDTDDQIIVEKNYTIGLSWKGKKTYMNTHIYTHIYIYMCVCMHKYVRMNKL